MGIHRCVWVRLSRGAVLGVDSSSRVIVATCLKVGLAMELNPEALQLNYRLTPKADNA
jgi:hypothetical protein